MSSPHLGYETNGGPNWPDDDMIYGTENTELDSAVYINEFELSKPPPGFRDGATKSSTKGSESASLVYQRSQAQCSVSVTRLLWVDGWRSPDCFEAMTLVVLRLGFKPEGRNAKVTYAALQLRLKSDRKEDEDPQLVAWGPFRHPETWNGVEAHKRVNVTPSIKLAAEVSGQGVTAGVEKARETGWDETYTDHGRSSEKFSRSSEKFSRSSEKFSKRKKGPPNGVLWEVHQNKQLKRGITPEIRVAALFSRPRPGHYRVEVIVTADTGIGSQISQLGLRLFGQPGGDRIYWRATEKPGCRDNFYAEGSDIIKEVDASNLGKLVGTGDRDLSPAWLNKWERVEMPKVTTNYAAKPTHVVAQELEIRDQYVAADATCSFSSLQKATGLRSGAEEASGSVMPMPKAPSDAEGANLPETGNLQPADKQEIMQFQAPQHQGNASPSPLPSYYSRLVALEERAARAEACITEQNRHIIELQQTLTRVTQALLTVQR